MNNRASRNFIDIDASFEPHPVTGDLRVRTDERAIMFAIRSLIETNYFERPFRPEIGSPIRQLLFELSGDQFNIMLRKAVVDLITAYEPRVELLDVGIDDSADNNRVNIIITFRIKNTLQPFQMSVALERTR